MADKKPQKLKARLPRGLADRGPAEIAATRAMVETIRKQFEHYGFEPVETPAIEYTDALGKFLPDQDRPNEGVFSFQDDDEQWMSLRYDLTAPLARHVAENFQNIALPYRSYRFGWVFRNEKPGPGRYRQFMQFDADTVGAPTMAADAEMCMLAADTMEHLQIRDDLEIPLYVVKVNSRKILDALMEAIELGGADNSIRRLQVLRAIDKLDRLGVNGVRELLGKERKDESGDITKGANLAKEQIDQVMAYVMSVAVDWRQHSYALTKSSEADPYSHQCVLAQWQTFVGKSEIGKQAIDELCTISELVTTAGYANRIKFASDVIRGLEYYTGPVYEVELLIETKDEKGRPVRFGSVGGGGRYDGLVSRFMGQPVPATGFSIGVSRLQAALTLIGKLDSKPPAGPVLVTIFGDTAAAQALTATLRKAGIRAEMYLGNPKKGVGDQLKYADKRRSPCAVIQGSNEKEKGVVIVRDLIAGAAPSSTADRDEHLKKQAEAQQEVPEAKMVEAVKKVLAKHGLTPGVS